MRTVESTFEPLPAQWRLFRSTARIRGYGGAMGGGKSRALCELAFDLALNHPGIVIPICRQSHVSIVGTTKKTMLEQVLPRALIEHQKASMGEDYVRLVNGSELHFYGLDDPGRLFSAEYGFVCFDEAHQIGEDAVLTVNTRLRQRCRDCIRTRERHCSHFPHGMVLGFNPENPGHWLYRWFLDGAEVLEFTEQGFASWCRKDGVYPGDSVSPIGDAEFILSRATDNPYLSPEYVELNLKGMKPLMRRRYLEGEWLYTAGRMFFDPDALADYRDRVQAPPHVCTTAGDVSGRGEKVRFVPGQRHGGWWLWEPPVREREDEETGRLLPAHRYVVAVDVSSGSSNDYSAIQVLDVEEFAQVAEFQGLLDMDEVALEAFRAAVVYNGALLVPETTGGWGAAVMQRFMKLIPAYKGPPGSKPKPYTRKVVDRLSKKWTDRTGWDTNVATRAAMLDLLEEVFRKGHLGLRSSRCHTEMLSFVWPERKKDGIGGPFMGIPQAQPGTNDDLVLALAIGVAVVLERPKVLRRPVQRPHQAAFRATGY